MKDSRLRTGALEGTRAIVTNADTRLGLYVIRALGRSGCRVTAVTTKQDGNVVGFASRYASEYHRLPAGPSCEVLPEAIAALADRHDVLLPVSSESLLIIGGAADDLRPRIRFYIPPLPSLQAALDKRVTTHVGRNVGVPVPWTYGRLDPATIDSWAAEERPTFPLVIKFADDRRSAGWEPAERYRIVRSPDELTREYRRMHRIGEYPVVQEYVDGDGFGFFAIFSPSGEPFARFCHRRLREYPPSGGPSTLCESVYDETLMELGTRLLKALGWRGVAMVEFKRDRNTGEFKLLEINPRFWGSLPLALACGINFPAYQAQFALGRTPQPQNGYPTGKRMRFFFSDLLAVRELWQPGDRLRVMRGYVRELCDLSIKDGLFDIDDPKPLLTYLRQRVDA